MTFAEHAIRFYVPEANDFFYCFEEVVIKIHY